MHREYEDLLLLYTTHSLDETGKQRLETHLQSCEACRASLKEWRAISTAVRAVANQRADSLPALRLPDLEQEKNTMQSTHSLPQRHYYVPVTFAAIAVMLIFAAAVLFMRTPGSTLSVFVQPTTADTVEIVMPTRPIRADRRIDSDDIALVAIPIEVAPANRLTSLEDVIGKFTRTDIFCGQPILSTMLTEYSPYVPQYHGFLEMNSDEACNISPNPADELVNVVVARQTIHRQETISEDMVELRPYPSQLIPANAVLHIEDVVDQAAIIDIFEEQFISEQIISDVIPPLIPDNMVRATVLLDSASNAISIARQYNRVDLNATLSFVDDYEGVDDDQGWRLVTSETPGATSTSIQVAYNAFVLGFSISENGEVDQHHLIVAVPLDEAMVLSFLFEAQIPVIVSPASDTTSFNLPDPAITPLPIPDGMVAVSVPRTLVLAAPVGQLSDRVDIVITLRFVDIDEEFQVLVPTGTPPDTQSVTQVSISNALQIPSDDPDVMTFVVSPADAVVLRWLIEARIPLILVSPGSWPGDPILVPTNP